MVIDLVQMPIFSKPVTELLQLRVLCLGLLKDWNIWIGVFPQRQKFLVRRATLGIIALERVGATQLEMRQRPDGFIQNDAAMIEDFLKLCRRFLALGSARFQHFPPQEPVCLGLVAWAALF